MLADKDLVYTVQNIRNELSIYSQLVDFDKLFLELDLYYKMKTDNFDNLDELILKFKQKCFRDSFLSSFPNIISRSGRRDGTQCFSEDEGIKQCKKMMT